MYGMTRDCIREAAHRKLFFIYGIILLISVGIIVLAGSIEFQLGGEESFGTDDISDMLGYPVVSGLNFFLWMLVFLSVMATAGLVPNMLSRGRAEFFLSKPVSRSQLLISKVWGIWVTYGGLVAICGLVGILVIYLTHGFFTTDLLWLIGGHMVIFGIWLSITVAVGIYSGSTSISFMAVFLIWVAQWVLSFREWIQQIVSSKALDQLIDVLYYIVPKTGEIENIVKRMALGAGVESLTPLYSSLLFAAVMYGVAIWLFGRKDY